MDTVSLIPGINNDGLIHLLQPRGYLTSLDRNAELAPEERTAFGVGISRLNFMKARGSKAELDMQRQFVVSGCSVDDLDTPHQA